MIDPKLLDILACPVCKGPLHYHHATDVLICRADRLGYPIREGIPVMLTSEATHLSSDEIAAL